MEAESGWYQEEEKGEGQVIYVAFTRPCTNYNFNFA